MIKHRSICQVFDSEHEFVREDNFPKPRTMKVAVIFCLITVVVCAANGEHGRNDAGGMS